MNFAKLLRTPFLQNTSRRLLLKDAFLVRILDDNSAIQILPSKSYFHSSILRNCKSSCTQMFFEKGVPENLAAYTRKHMSWSPFLIKLQAWNPAFLSKGTPTHVFSCKYCEIFKNSFFMDRIGWLILKNSLKWSNTHKQFVYNKRVIARVCLTILWGWHLKS